MRYLHLLYRSLQFETKYFLTYPDLECELIEERRTRHCKTVLHEGRTVTDNKNNKK